ncbi:MAG: ribulose-phosphate 3-epimerase [bacterium]|nr:ribulose-phosphate 3-epimerase [bacterium]
MSKNSKKIIIAPSILSADFGNLEKEIQDIVAAGADWIHIDVMDGSFVPPITFGDNLVKIAKKNCSLPLDVHLMVVDPEKHIEAFKNAGCHSLTIHVEACKDPLVTINKIKDAGLKVGISLKPATPVSQIETLIEQVDLVLVMTVKPGWSGQSFMPECLSKIEKIHSIIKQRNLPVHIEVDGGINKETAIQCIQAGATILVAGSFVFGSKNRKEAILSLKELR